MRKKNKIQDRLLNTDRDLVNDIELATYIDARERYDRLGAEYEQHVIDHYKDESQRENL